MADSRVEKIIDELIKSEGGYVNDPDDNGGPTKYGITQATLTRYLGRQATIQDVKNLTVELAKEIYRQNYYYGPRINALPDLIEPVMLDMMVTHRPKVCWKLLQGVINEAGFGPVDEDGVPGPQTFKAATIIADAMKNYLVNALVDARNAFFKAIVEHEPKQSKFLKGWLNRSERFREKV